MVFRAPVVLAIALAILLIVAGLAMLIPHGGERMVARAASKVAAASLRDCLGSKLGLTFSGDEHAQHGSKFGLRVVVTDNVKSRSVGLFAAGGRQLTSSESEALQGCLASPT